MSYYKKVGHMSVAAHTDLHDQPPLAVRAEKLLHPPRAVAKVLSQCGTLGTCRRGLCARQANALHARPRPHVHAQMHTSENALARSRAHPPTHTHTHTHTHTRMRTLAP